ncbi:prepilin-type N-terminal cleavage/methylation domain-containing protein [Stenotrophomonas sp. PA-6-5C]|uniref:GspH/FimT family pseudopilin n=1 Tax=Stenotrophomonas sp. PA-6-5C TaxID=2665487 RepID=UPI001F42BD22|nr:GspH/FimT family pseudopilin [Stenotrophomonas sp. PA-6-5C]MCF5090012.1 prepilin-type N-terminal cleavage/methylation domain-containing protein [Stenotrophomonas sp. PA-6-5C]
MSARRSNGFTLVELMVTLVVLGVLASIAFPSFRGLIRSNRISTSNNEIVGVLSLARSEAIRNGRGAGVCASTKGFACDGTWSDGLMAWADSDAAGGAFQDGETVLRFVAGNTTQVVTGPNEAIAFDPRGRRRATANQSLELQPSDCKADDPKRKLTVNLSGQVRVERTTCK